MPKWGYSVSKDNQIDFDSNNRDLATKLQAAEPSFNLCFACGSCAGTCSVNSFDNFSLRKINIAISRGEMKQVKQEIEKCMLCGKCSLVCPRGVNTRNLILNIKKLLN